MSLSPSGRVHSAPPIQEVIDAGGGEYNALENHAPKLTGKLFAWFCNFLWTPFGEKWVLQKLMNDNRLFAARERYLPEAATFYPTPPFVPFPEQTGGDKEGREEKSKEEEIESLLHSDSHEESGGGEFVFPSVMEYLRGYRCGSVTPEAVAERIIESIGASESLSPPLRAFVQWNESEIRKQAAESTRRYKEEDNIRPLEGVPVGIKESIPTKPYALRIGTSFIPIGAQNFTEQDESEVVLKLRNAGAIIVGVNNLHEYGIGGTGVNPNELHGTPCNPYGQYRYPGGSSSGAGVAVASGLIPLAIGTDGGGSIRIPASLCGIVGLKATFGRISDARSVTGAPTVSHVGPMCTSVADTALAYLILAGADKTVPPSIHQGLVTVGDYLDASQRVKGLKVGVYRAWFDHCDSEVRKACERALTYIREAGAEVVDVHIPELNQILTGHVQIFLPELRSAFGYDFCEHFQEINPHTKLLLSISQGVTGSDYIVAARQRTRSIMIMKYLFKKVDILVTPATACTAPGLNKSILTHGESDIHNVSKLIRYTVLGNMTGVPGIALPVGYDSNNLPISLQLMSSWWRDWEIVRVIPHRESDAWHPGHITQDGVANKFRNVMDVTLTVS